jgi:polysaccharide deacetylase family protein (PEP-CTERM system associated)
VSGRESAIEPITNVLSIDLEDYFQVETFRSRVSSDQWSTFPSRIEHSTGILLGLLSEFDVRATFFVLGWIADRHPRLVQEIDRAGHEVASHGYGHQAIYRQDVQTFREDVTRAKHVLEDLIGKPVLGYRAPTFSVVEKTLWALDVLLEAGYRYDSSIFPVRHDRYGIPGANPFVHRAECAKGRAIIEFPPLTLRLGRTVWPAAGGGYLRLLPPQLIHWAVARHNREGHAAMLYVHPWEVDPGQPRLPVGLLSRTRHYLNLSRTLGRVRSLLQRFRFDRAQHVLAQRYGFTVKQ